MLVNISFRIIKVANYRHEKDKTRKEGKYFDTFTCFNLPRRQSFHTSYRSLPEVTKVRNIREMRVDSHLESNDRNRDRGPMQTALVIFEVIFILLR